MVATMISNARRADNVPARPPLTPSPLKGNAANPNRQPTKKSTTFPSPSSTTTKQRPPVREPSAASLSFSATTRTLSISFQGESFVLRTIKTKPPSPEHRKPTRSIPASPRGSSLPTTGNRKPSMLSRSMDFSTPMKEPVLSAVRLLKAFDDRSARFWLDTTGRPASSPATPKKLSVDGKFSSHSLHMNGAVRPTSPAKVPALPSNTSFVDLARRAKRGERRIEEAHMLRMLYNQYMQWRFVNARSSKAVMAQKINAEKDLRSAWIKTSELRESVTAKRLQLQLLKQNLKLAPIFGEQMTYLEEWSFTEKEHLRSLIGTAEALKGSTIRLPVVGGAKADTQEVKDAVDSATTVMQAMETCICSPLAQVEQTSALMSELAEIAAKEQGMLEQAKNLLSVIDVMHVKQCSLRGQILQMTRESGVTQM